MYTAHHDSSGVLRAEGTNVEEFVSCAETASPDTELSVLTDLAGEWTFASISSESDLEESLPTAAPKVAVMTTAVVHSNNPINDCTIIPPGRPVVTSPNQSMSDLGRPTQHSTPASARPLRIVSSRAQSRTDLSDRNWGIMIDKGCRAILQSPLKDGMIEWNDSLKIATFADGVEAPGERPDPEALHSWNSAVALLPLPCAEKLNGRWILREYPGVEWVENTAMFVNRETGLPVSGFRRDAVYWTAVTDILPHGSGCPCINK